MDTEYRSYYYTKIRHEDPWNERVRHTREVKVGEDKHGNPIYETEVYYTTEYHDDAYYKFSNEESKTHISESEFYELKNLWNTSMRFVDMHRNYYTIDGDAQEYDFCGHWDHMRGYTEECTYENRVAGSNSILNLREVSDKEAEELGLFKYSTATVYGKCTDEARKRFEYLNYNYGKLKQIHIKVLIFPPEQSVAIVEDQRAYWKGGNKNEFVICIGSGWADCFSWQDNKELDVRCRNYIIQKKPDLVQLSYWVEENLGLWKRKEFKDFSYIGTYLTGTQNLIILCIVLVLSCILTFVAYEQVCFGQDRTFKKW